MPPVAPRSSDAIFASERVNAELFTLTYGAIFRQLITDIEEIAEVNKQLDQIIVFQDNPLVEFVEFPDTYQGLNYCNILSGVLRGALETVSMKTEVTWIRDMLGGDDAFELQVKLVKQVPEEYPYEDDE